MILTVLKQQSTRNRNENLNAYDNSELSGTSDTLLENRVWEPSKVTFWTLKVFLVLLFGLFRAFSDFDLGSKVLLFERSFTRIPTHATNAI